ncbi:SLBB domain-containing protein [Amylibacter sp.]|nr:SLBB domain-containing protein [Amylibacter sp.]
MKFFVKLCFIYFLITGYVHAQTEDLKAILSQNLPQNLENFQMSNGISENYNGKGVPSASNPEILNTLDIYEDTQNISQTKKSTFQEKHEIKKPISTLVNYYKILTGYELPVYGAEEFNQEEKSQLLFFNTMSKDYQLAAGDILKITIRGLRESDESLKIGIDSNLILSGLPPINVHGLTINGLEESLTELLRIDDASALVNVALDAARLVAVQVSGNVDSPRTLAVPAYTPLSRIISYAGGISETGSLRNITLIESDGTQSSMDFYAFLQNPFNSNDPLISSNARIFIGVKGATIAASGHVARPGIFELSEGQVEIGYKELLRMAGTTLLAPGSSLQARSFDINGVLNSRNLENGDSIAAGEALHVEFVETKNLNTISVSGAVLKEFTIPTFQPVSVASALKGGAVLNADASLNFALLSGQNIETKAINLHDALKNEDIKIPVGADLTVFDENSYSVFIDNYNKKSQILDNLSIKDANIASIYVDGKMKKLIAPGGLTHRDKIFRNELDKNGIYELYFIHTFYNETSDFWEYKPGLVSRLKDIKSPITIGKKDKFELFTQKFIRNKLFSNIQNKSIENMSDGKLFDLTEQARVKTNNSEPIKETIQNLNNTNAYDPNANAYDPNANAYDPNDLNIDKMRQSSRHIYGEVYFPGRYPIAENVSLDKLIEQAGGITEAANTKSIELALINEINGSLALTKRFEFNYSDLSDENIPESNSFTLRVNSLINDADIGRIILSGEVQKPGTYRFSRAETLHDIINRAGGFTEVAYPVGSVFTREKIKKSQTANNKMLASQLEKSLLRVSQQDIGDASTQINAILGFTDRLKNIEVLGRMSVNAVLKDVSTPVYLEDMDTVFIPKRPSHVSIIGAVGRETVGIYATSKTVYDYIDDAGGLSRNSNLKISYILLPNGESKPLSKNTIVTPGSVLVIMPKTDKLSILGLTTVVSRVMGNIATSILAINNVK